MKQEPKPSTCWRGREVSKRMPAASKGASQDWEGRGDQAAPEELDSKTATWEAERGSRMRRVVAESIRTNNSCQKREEGGRRKEREGEMPFLQSQDHEPEARSLIKWPIKIMRHLHHVWLFF